jgi:hypothetical protein
VRQSVGGDEVDFVLSLFDFDFDVDGRVFENNVLRNNRKQRDRFLCMYIIGDVPGGKARNTNRIAFQDKVRLCCPIDEHISVLAPVGGDSSERSTYDGSTEGVIVVRVGSSRGKKDILGPILKIHINYLEVT